MANKDLPNGFRAVMSGSGSPPPVFEVMTAANLALNPGDFLTMLSNGTVTITTSSSTSIFGLCQSKVSAESGVSKKIRYIPALDDLIYEGQCSGTFTPVNVGESVDIEGTTGIMEVNEDAQSTGVIRIVGLAKGVDNAAGANARVNFTITKSQWNGQA